MMTNKKILVFSILTFTFTFAAAAILDSFSRSFWKKTTTKKKKKKIQLMKEEEEEKPNPESAAADRISELPIEILHHILGFLNMEEILQTSLVSTKWRYLWKSVPTLNFEHPRSDYSSITSIDGHSLEKDENFVNHVLRLRDSEASKIKIFNYSWISSFMAHDNFEWIHNLMVTAVNQGAQMIKITGVHCGHRSDMIHLNPSIFTSGVLRNLAFALYNLHFPIQFPRSMCCATKLTHLHLCGIRLPEGDDSINAAELHLVCPVLEVLIMRDCCSDHLRVLDISAPRLDTLSICNNTRMRYRSFDCLGGCRIEIRSPNLTSLDYIGCVYVDCFTVNLPRIANASLRFIIETGMVVEETSSFAIKLLKGLTSAESLTLGGFEVFSQDTLKKLLAPFTSLRILNLITSCNISSIHGMVHFLNSCNSVEELVWFMDDMIPTVEGDEHLILPQCRLSHLKHVHIKKLRGHKNEIEFVKFLLKSSVVLEYIVINTTSGSLKRSIEKNLKQFIEEEASVRRSIKLYVLSEES